jgi:ATP-dependent HslUV protease subunit HslV
MNKKEVFESSFYKVRATTVLAVRKNNEVAMAGDGQVTFTDTIMKHKAKKIRKMYNGKVLAGFAGSVADAFTLFERFEGKLESYAGNLGRAAVELAKEWRTDKYLRRLEALLLVVDRSNILVISGSGEVIEPDEDVIGIGSGGGYANAAAKALLKHSSLSAKDIVLESLKIASEICVFTNNEFTIEVLK